MVLYLSCEKGVFSCPPISVMPVPILLDSECESNPEDSADFGVLSKDSFSQFAADVETAAFSAAAIVGRRPFSKKRPHTDVISKGNTSSRPKKLSRYSMGLSHFGTPNSKINFGDFPLVGVIKKTPGIAGASRSNASTPLTGSTFGTGRKKVNLEKSLSL